ncbi:hypothetical protein L596_012263 [Steinernema carpocapsae]|uniref:Uncharacterized protein n=1 Tax=Steinernema carpocapsae TaxID=34508 RepID=A0A4U5NWH3_STECR|nr:hypothetical protein L596_012263 [Steinernema carpocapsae]
MNLFRVLLTAIAFISKTSESQSYFECRSNTNSSLGYLDTFVKCDLDGSQSCFQLAIPSNKERSGIRLYGCISDSELPDEFSEKKADKGLYRTRFQMTLEEKKYIGAVKLCAVHRCNELDFVMVEPLKQRMSSFLTRYLGIVYPFLIPLALFFVSGYPGIVSYRRNKRLRRDEFGDTGKPLDTLLFPGSTFETSTEEIVTTRVPCRVVNLCQVQTLIQKLRFSTTLPQWNQEIQKNNAKDWIQKTVTINPTITTYEQDHIGYVKPIRRQPSKCEKLLHRLLEHGPGLFPFNAAELGDLFNEATDVFASEPSLITVPPGVVIYGDIRGQYTDLYRWFYINGFPPSRRKQVFLGGIVSDGNDFSLETLALLAALKISSISFSCISSLNS